MHTLKTTRYDYLLEAIYCELSADGTDDLYDWEPIVKEDDLELFLLPNENMSGIFYPNYECLSKISQDYDDNFLQFLNKPLVHSALLKICRGFLDAAIKYEKPNRIVLTQYFMDIHKIIEWMQIDKSRPFDSSHESIKLLGSFLNIAKKTPVNIAQGYVSIVSSHYENNYEFLSEKEKHKFFDGTLDPLTKKHSEWSIFHHFFDTSRTAVARVQNLETRHNLGFGKICRESELAHPISSEANKDEVIAERIYKFANALKPLNGLNAQANLSAVSTICLIRILTLMSQHVPPSDALSAMDVCKNIFITDKAQETAKVNLFRTGIDGNKWIDHVDSLSVTILFSETLDELSQVCPDPDLVKRSYQRVLASALSANMHGPDTFRKPEFEKFIDRLATNPSAGLDKPFFKRIRAKGQEALAGITQSSELKARILSNVTRMTAGNIMEDQLGL